MYRIDQPSNSLFLWSWRRHWHLSAIHKLYVALCTGFNNYSVSPFIQASGAYILLRVQVLCTVHIHVVISRDEFTRVHMKSRGVNIVLDFQGCGRFQTTWKLSKALALSYLDNNNKQKKKIDSNIKQKVRWIHQGEEWGVHNPCEEPRINIVSIDILRRLNSMKTRSSVKCLVWPWRLQSSLVLRGEYSRTDLYPRAIQIRGNVFNKGWWACTTHKRWAWPNQLTQVGNDSEIRADRFTMWTVNLLLGNAITSVLWPTFLAPRLFKVKKNRRPVTRIYAVGLTSSPSGGNLTLQQRRHSLVAYKMNTWMRQFCSLGGCSLHLF